MSKGREDRVMPCNFCGKFRDCPIERIELFLNQSTEDKDKVRTHCPDYVDYKEMKGVSE